MTLIPSNGRISAVSTEVCCVYKDPSVRHSGRAAIAARAGIHNHRQWLWIPGSRAEPVPGQREALIRAPAPRNDEPELKQVRVISCDPKPRRSGSSSHSVEAAVRDRRGGFTRDSD